MISYYNAQDVSRLYKAKKDDVRVTLVESNQILSSFDEKLRNYAAKKIQERKGFTLMQDFVTGTCIRRLKQALIRNLCNENQSTSLETQHYKNLPMQ